MEKTKYFKSIKQRDPAARHALQIIICYSGVQAMFWFRIAHFFYKIKLKLLAEFIMYLVRCFLNIEIHPAATIGKRLFIDHGCGVVIGETAVIGNDVTMYHGVTLGGTGHDKGQRHPTIGNNVIIGATAQIIGNIVIGDWAKIGANATVVHDVPSRQTIVGNKGRIVEK